MTLQVRHLSKHYGSTPVFSNVSLDVAPGEFVAIVGESGAGKSTLLNCMAGLDTWDSGSVHLGGTDLGTLTNDQCALLRRKQVGFVFQAFHVLPHLDVFQNVALPFLLLGREDPDRVNALLHAVGLGDLGARLPQQLSGGQLQRVAIARALINDPVLIMGDEPTGNLDKKNTDVVFNIFQRLSKEFNQTMLIVTHDQEFAKKTHRIIEMEDGKIIK